METTIDKATAAGIANLFAGSTELRVLFPAANDAIGTLAVLRALEEICTTKAYCIIGDKNRRAHEILEENAVCYYGNVRHLNLVEKFDVVVFGGQNDKNSVVNAIELSPLLEDGTLIFLPVRIKRGLEGMEYEAQNQLAKMVHFGYNLIGIYRFATNMPAGILIFKKSRQTSTNIKLPESFTDAGMKINREIAGKMRITLAGRKEPSIKFFQFSDAALSHIFQAMESELPSWNLETKKATSQPLIPLSPWHSLLAVSSGLYRGPLVTEERTVLVKGRIIIQKTENQREVEFEKGNGTIDQLIEAERKYVPAVEMTVLDITANSETFGEVFNVR